MMNTKYYRNPARSQAPTPYQPYIPQYQMHGITPASSGVPQTHQEEKKAKAPPFSAYVLPKVRQPRPLPTTQNVPYAETDAPAFGGPLPNSGNNVENTWSGVDGLIVDDLSDQIPVDVNKPMIDNNEYIQTDANLPNEYYLRPNQTLTVPYMQTFSPPQQFTQPLPAGLTAPEYRTEAVPEITVYDANQLNIGYEEYLLMVKGEVLCSGSLEQVQKEVQSLVFEEHELSAGGPISLDEIVVLKRVKIKVGVFLGE